MSPLAEKIRDFIEGEIHEDEESLARYSHDASIFEIRPQLVVIPKNIDDLKKLVAFVANEKKTGSNLSLTARAGGSDMSGGALTDSILVVFTNFDHIGGVDPEKKTGTAEPGVWYRDFEKETLKNGLFLPSYPASREICAIGGIVNNNSGGEKSLTYGKTEDYIEQIKMVLADGNEYVFGELKEEQLKEKLALQTFEGDVYRKIYNLIIKNWDTLKAAKPNVSKNSAGYYLWSVWNPEKKTFNLARLFVGAQGTLGLMAEATLRLIPLKNHSGMAVIFLNDFTRVTDVVDAVLPLKPESFESYDDHTLKLAIKFFMSFAKLLGTRNFISLGLQFLPDAWMLVTGGMPKLVLLAEFTSNNEVEVAQKLAEVKNKIRSLGIAVKLARNTQESKKYWAIRRESFNLLRQRIKGKHTAPFIDDFIVRPEYYREFLPKLNEILGHYPHFIYTIQGHVGDGNFHIIPLMDLSNPEDRNIIPELSKKVYDLVLKYRGSITAEHNDGLIRTPFLKQMYGEKICQLFEETKRIFDPDGIFNPRKKVGGDLEYALAHIVKS